MNCHVSVPPSHTLVRAIQCELWSFAEKEFRQQAAPTPLRIIKQKTSSGTWSYSIETIHGTPHYVTRYNGALKTAIPFTPTP